MKEKLFFTLCITLICNVFTSQVNAEISKTFLSVADVTLTGINIPSTNLQSKQSNQSQKGSANEANNKNADSRTYSNYETQLIKMNTNYERDYNDSTRKDIQRKMKSIRQKWVDRGYNMYKSTWEDWNGVKR